MWPPREKLLRLLGQDTAQSDDAVDICQLFTLLRKQREDDIDKNDVEGSHTNYYYAANVLFDIVFEPRIRALYDDERKSLWYLGWQVRLSKLYLCTHLSLTVSRRDRNRPNISTVTSERDITYCSRVGTYIFTDDGLPS
jgi:hypothetical protein